jgi:hypothetical protein
MAWPTLSSIKDLYTSQVGVAPTLGDTILQLYIDVWKEDFLRETGYDPDTTGTAVVRYFSGNNQNILPVHPFTSLTKVSFVRYDGQTPEEHFEFINVIPYGREIAFNNFISLTQPIINNYGAYVNLFPNNRDSIKVEAVWGCGASFPNDIKIGLMQYIRSIERIATNEDMTTDSDAVKAIIHADREVHYNQQGRRVSILNQFSLKSLAKKYASFYQPGKLPPRVNIGGRR